MPRKPTIAPEIVQQIHTAWEAAPHGTKGDIIASWAERLGVEKTTVYRARSRRYGKAKQVEREVQIEQSLIDEVAVQKIRLMEAGLVEREIATQLIIDYMVDEGVEGADKLVASTVNRRMRKAGFREAETKVRVEAAHPNHVWQMDFSRSKHFQVKERLPSGDYLLEISGRHLHYKEQGGLRNLWLVQAKDSYSRLRLGAGYIATGETADLGLTFLDHCFRREDDGLNPMRGVPYVFKIDNGAFGKSEVFGLAAEALGLDVRFSTPYKKDSQGKIESAWRWMWAQFELPLVMRYGKGWRCTLSEYNELMHEYFAKDGQKKHPWRDLSRDAIYRTALRMPSVTGEACLRTFEDDLLRYACHVLTRTVSVHRTVSIDNVQFAVPEIVQGVSIEIGAELRILRNRLGEFIAKPVDYHTEFFALAPYEPAQFDDFSGRAAQTYRQQMETQLAQRRKEGTALLAQPEHSGDGAVRPLSLPTPEVEVVPGGAFGEQPPAPAPTLTYNQARVQVGLTIVEVAPDSTYATFAAQLDPKLRAREEEGALTEDYVQQVCRALRNAFAGDTGKTARRKTA